MLGRAGEVCMERLFGVRVNDRDLKGLSKVADLIYFDGPLLSLFTDKFGNSYLFYWVDSDNISNRWLVFRVTERQIAEYMNRQIPLTELVNNPCGGYHYSVDITERPDQNLELENVTIVSPNDLPLNYKPRANSFYASEPIYYQDGRNFFKIPIEGKWSLDDLSYFPNVFSQAYAFIYSISNHFWGELRPGQFDGEKVERAFKAFPWRGGYSAVNFYSSLESSIPKNRRPEVARLQFASPGVIGLSLYTPVAQQLTTHVKAFFLNYDDVTSLYKEIYKYLSDKKLLRDADSKVFSGEPGISETLIQFTKEMAALLGIDEERLNRINGLTEENPLATLKIILSFYRRVKELATFERRGQAKYI